MMVCDGLVLLRRGVLVLQIRRLPVKLHAPHTLLPGCRPTDASDATTGGVVGRVMRAPLRRQRRPIRRQLWWRLWRLQLLRRLLLLILVRRLLPVACVLLVLCLVVQMLLLLLLLLLK